MLCIAIIHPLFLTEYEAEEDLRSVGTPERLVIKGLVDNPINITYEGLRNFPLVSEGTMLECAGSGGGVGWGVTYNWTGVPLFYLLSMAKVIPGDYREVVFNATDGFSSSVLLETAMHPTTILALEANGTDLEWLGGFGSGYRVVIPCRWGYKWVTWIKQIIVVDYDYKGTYERAGYSDEALRPNCTMPSTDPPLQTFNATKLTNTGPKEYPVQALSNSSIEHFSFESDAQLIFNITGPEETSGYFYVKFPRELLTGPYQVYVNQSPIEHSQTDTNSNVYLYFAYTHSNHTITIEGTPEGGTLKISYDDTPSGEGKSLVHICLHDSEGRITGYDPWNGEVKVEIPNSTYMEFDTQLVKIGSPGGSYIVDVWGTGHGSYELKVVNIALEYQYENVLKGTTTHSELGRYRIDVHPDGTLTVTQVSLPAEYVRILADGSSLAVYTSVHNTRVINETLCSVGCAKRATFNEDPEYPNEGLGTR